MASVSDLWDDAFSHTREHVKEHHLNHAYLEGFQWMDWNPVELQVQGLPEDHVRIQATMNHMRANVRTIVSQLTQRELSFEVPASAYDDATLRAAKTAEALLAEIKRDHGWEVLREAHMKATLKGGSGAVVVDWSMANETTVETVLGTPEFVLEPGARNAERARWFIKLQLMPPAEVQAMWPDVFKDGPPKANGRVGMASSYEYKQRDAPTTRVLTYYERPNPLQPEGRVIVEADGKTLEAMPWPFPWKHKLNISVARESLIENEAYGSTILSDVRSPQTALNAAWSSVLEHLREMSNHRWVFDQSWEDQINVLNDRPGQPLVGRLEKGAPQVMKAPSAPTISLDAIRMLKAEIDNLTGVHDVSRGQAPANVESGYGLSILAEKDSSPVGRLIKEEARVWGDVAWMVLELHQAQVTKPRTTSIRDSSGPARREWKGSDLMDQTGAIVPLDAIIPKSQAAQQAWAEQAVQMGLISSEDPLAVMRFAKLADMPDQRGIVNATLPDASKAIRENESVVMDEVPLPREFDGHEIHIEIHNDFRKSLQYELLTPQQQKDIDNHVRAHEEMAQEALAKRRLGTEIDPALGAVPTAEGAPPVEALPPVGPPPGMPGPAPDGAAALPSSPDDITQEMLKAIQGL